MIQVDVLQKKIFSNLQQIEVFYCFCERAGMTNTTKRKLEKRLVYLLKQIRTPLVVHPERALPRANVAY
jgi:hypothetical protein